MSFSLTNKGKFNVTPPTLTDGQVGEVQLDSAGNQKVVLASGNVTIGAGSNLIGGVELVDSGGTNKASISAGGAVKVDGSAVTQPVSGTVTANAGSGTFAVSAASLPLPTGAATSAKQPALGTAGTASTDVLTVQGITSMTPFKVNVADGSGNLITSTGNKLDVNATFSGSISGNAAASNTGSAVPVAADYLGAKDGSGNLVGLLAESVTHPNLRVSIYNGANEAAVSAGGAITVDGSAVTQPISAASLPLPTGASTAAKQPALGTAGSASADVITVQGIASMTALKVDGSAVTQPVSAASLPLPTGAATAAKQPALGTAGSAATDVITVQGITSMTPLSVSGTISQGTSAGLGSGWPVINGTVAVQTAAWTSATSGNSAVTISTAGYNVALVTLVATSTMTGGVLTFEASDDNGTTYYPIQVARVNSAAIETTFSLAVTTGQAWQANIAGFTNFRVRLSTVITGSGTATIRVQGSAGSAVPDMTVQGSVSLASGATVGQGTAATATAGWPVIAGSITSASSNWTSATSGNSTVAVTTLGYSVVQIAFLVLSGSITGGVITFEVSDNNSDWFTASATRIYTATSESTYTLSGTAPQVWQANVAGFSNFRVRLSTVITGAGTAQIRVGGSAAVYLPPVSSSSAQGTAAALSGAWPVKLTDGTNTMPTMDVAARKGFMAITDGTNTLPTMDAVGRAGFQKITDGTNTMPTMDVAARKGFVVLTDGTNTSTVKAASTAPVATDTALVVAVSPNTPALPILLSGTSNTSAAAWTSATSSNTAVTLVNASLAYSSLLITLNQAPTGTLSSGTVNFEGSNDNSNWFAINAVSNLGVPVLNQAISFTTPATYSAVLLNIAGIQYIRVRLSSVIVGTGTVTVGYAAQAGSDTYTTPTYAVQSGTWTVQPGNTANTTPWLVQSVPATSGGTSVFHLASAASTNATNVKASAGQLYSYAITNTNAAIRYIVFHNTSGTPTAGASVLFKIGIPASGGANVSFEGGIAFSSGIAITTVTGAADNDTAAVAANDLIINLFYK